MVAWKLLLGYLPPRCGEWGAALDEKRRRYAEFCSFVVDLMGEADGASRKELCEDHFSFFTLAFFFSFL